MQKFLKVFGIALVIGMVCVSVLGSVVEARKSAAHLRLVRSANCGLSDDNRFLYDSIEDIFDRLVEAITVSPGQSELVPGVSGKLGHL